MPYPDDPFALTIRTSYKCPSCGAQPLIRSTKDQQSAWMGQVSCTKCPFTTDIVSFRQSVAAGLKKPGS